MVELKNYNKDFYSDQEVSSLNSAKALLPILNDLFAPKSVVDVGCGIGAWLRVWQTEFNISDFYGVEAPFILKEMLIVDSSKILLTDLNKPFDLGHQYDIAMSLEVAEHIEPLSADQFVQNLTKLSSVVIFSAAIPGQEGTFHVNEQWPEYWAEKFRALGYVALDCLRKKIWNDERINFWYRQNILVFIKLEALPNYPELQTHIASTDYTFLTRIHPELLRYKSDIIVKLYSPLGYWRMLGYHAKLWLRKKIKK